MVNPKVGQVWTIKNNNENILILTVGRFNVNVSSNDGYVWDVHNEDLKKDFIFNKEETLKHLKQQQEEINQQLEELNKSEIVKHKFEVVINAPTDFDSNRILKSIEYTTSSYWKENLIESYYVDVIKE